MDHGALNNKLAALALAISEATSPATEDLGPSDVAGLAAIANGGPLSIAEIAAAAGVSPSAAVRLVDRLERAWLVRRLRRVAREVMVETTARGRKRAEALAERRLAAARLYTGGLTEVERSQLGALIDRIVAGRLSPGDGSPALVVVHHCRFCQPDLCDCGLAAPDTADPDQVAGSAR